MGVLPLDLLERMDGDCLVAMVNVEEIFGQEALVHVVEGQSAVEERKGSSAILGLLELRMIIHVVLLAHILRRWQP